MPEDVVHTSHAWVRWLSGMDAPAVLLPLCGARESRQERRPYGCSNG
jgi:hypothetical protein